jgi:transcriptional regulator with XRE-family HTH domain
MTTKDIHIGELIKNIVKQNRLTDDDFAKKINLSRTAIRNIYLKPHINTEQLALVSSILGHDFFRYYLEDPNEDSMQEFNEPTPVYKLPIKEVITVMVELDGTEEKIKKWFEKLRSINRIVAASNAT